MIPAAWIVSMTCALIDWGLGVINWHHWENSTLFNGEADIYTYTVEENTKIRNVTKDRNFGAKITYVSNISNLHNYENQ